MINDALSPEANPDVHIYKLKPWVILYYVFSLAFIGIAVGIPSEKG